MSEIKLVELACQRCGGELKEQNGAYVCVNCGKKWLAENMHGFTDMLEACEEALRAQRVADIANLRQLLWKQTHKEFVSNFEVERLCNEIQKYLPQDFYVNFYLATCSEGKTELGEFLYTVNVQEHYDDIPLVLDYLLKALKSEWTMGVSNFIDKFKDIDLGLYHSYRTKFDEEYNKIEDCIFEPSFPRDVFVAYSSKDMPKVMELVATLEEENLSCFVAVRNLRHGSGAVEKYEESLHAAIDHSTVLVFVSSDNSRSVRCDAYKELDYVIRNCPKKPRVEFVIKNYSGRASERFFEDFFKGLEYCTAAGDVAERVTRIIMSGGATPEPEPEPEKKSEPEPVKSVDVTKKLRRVRILVETGEFEEANSRLSKIESEEEERAGECEIAEVYHLKMLLDYGAKNDKILIEKLIKGRQYITDNKNYLLAKTCAEDSGDEAELATLLDIHTQIQNGIAAAEDSDDEAEEESMEQIDGDFEINDGVLVKYCGDGGDVVIPDGVTSIGEWAFSDCKSLISIIIPKGVTSIGEFAFWGCESLKSVIMPDGVTSIGIEAFNGCKSLTSITISNGVTSIGRGAFIDCASLTSITIPNSVTSIGEDAFYGCESLTNITIPNSVKSIEEGTFHDCASLTSIIIPNGVTTIGGQAFYGCKSLTSVIV